MKTSMKRILVTGLMVLGLGVVTQEAHAGTTDQMLISVTPGNVTYAVGITSPMINGYAFGTVNLGQTTISTVAIVVQSSGTIAEYFAMAVTADGGWTAVTVDTAAPALNTFEMQGHFSNAQPLDAGFSTTVDLVTGTAPGMAGLDFNQLGLGQTTPGNTQNLWLRLRMPVAVSASTQRTMTLTINGQAS